MSKNINSVTVTGNLTRDIELKHTSAGTAMGKFSIAVNESIKKGDVYEEYANFFDCTLWGKTAEALTPYLLKGKPVAISGRLRQSRWEGEEGKSRSKVEITVNEIQLLGGKSESSGPVHNPNSSVDTGADDPPW